MKDIKISKRAELVAFGNRMRKIREQKSQKMSQEQLSLISGLHRNYISDTERGTRNISLKAMVKIINALDCSIEEFFAEGFESLNNLKNK